MRIRVWAGMFVLSLGLLFAGSPAQALITRLTPLKDVLADSQFIFTAKVESIDPDKPAVVLNIKDDLKGKAAYRRLPINFTGDSEAQKEKQVPQLLKRLMPKLTLVVFVNENTRTKNYIGFAYTNGTWFQIKGVRVEDDRAVWHLTHGEPYLRRTFHGGTYVLKDIVKDGLAGAKATPEPDPKEPPGFGPEIKAEDVKDDMQGARSASEGGTIHGARSASEGGSTQHTVLRTPYSVLSTRDGEPPLFAVIPTLGIGGPLALLALLFPSVFGGVTGQFKRWLAALTIISMNSTLLFLHGWLADRFSGQWWSTPSVLWLTMTLLSVLGIGWACRRNARSIAGGNGAPPTRGEGLTLALVSIVGVALLGYCLLTRQAPLETPWNAVWPLWAAFWVGTLYFLFRRPHSVPSLSLEGIMLWSMTLAYVALSGTSWPRGGAAIAESESSGSTVHFAGVKWSFTAPDKGRFDSSPVVFGDRVYIAAAHDDAFSPFGRLYCLDRATGQVLWSFDNDGEMKQVFSTPRVTRDGLFIGEGFHEDKNCKLYCLDVNTGKKKWEFATSSHTESRPELGFKLLLGGTSGPLCVNFGAGDDGVYCLDATTGKEIWHFPGLHVDAGPVFNEGRLYIGSGVGDTHQATQIVCLDAEKGTVIWRHDTDLPVWASPQPIEDGVLFALGNGNFLSDADKPAGALLCVSPVDGTVLWRKEVPNAVLMQPCVAGSRIYYGSRDLHIYAFDTGSRAIVWQHDCGSPVVGNLTSKTWRGVENLYVNSTDGRVQCLDATNGRATWTFNIAAHAGKAVRLLSSPEVDSETPTRRQIYVAAGLKGVTHWSATLYCLEDQAAE
jgi:outer membrane protein assembly factor BamB